MDAGFEIFPDSASTISPQVDHLFLYLCAWSVVLIAVVALLIGAFSFRYRARAGSRPAKTHSSRSPCFGMDMDDRDHRHYFSYILFLGCGAICP